MKKIKIKLIILFLIGFSANYTKGQGCSDAGFCTINTLKPNSIESGDILSNQFKFGVFFGQADYSISVYGNYIEYNRRLNNKFGIDAKFTTLAQNGNEISVFGLSDIFLNTSYKANETVKLTLGVKLPWSKAGKTLNNRPLPMDYQASLGTFDLIFGIGYAINKLQIVAAVQQPLVQNNNQFIATDWPSGSKLRSFQSTNQFQRSGDVLIRLSYPVTINSKLKLTPSILPIYHLQNDKFTDKNKVIREITGSQGLTLNGTVYLDYEINTKNAILLNMGLPFIVRDARPDGLTRSFIANLEYTIKF